MLRGLRGRMRGSTVCGQVSFLVAHNEALRILDGLVQLSALDRDLTAPPGSPADGDRYIVGWGATCDWACRDLNVALWTGGAWLRLPPRTGWRAWVEDEGLLLVYDGATWIGTNPGRAAEPCASWAGDGRQMRRTRSRQS